MAPLWPRGAVQRPFGYVHSHYHCLRFLLHVHDFTLSLVDTSFKLGQPFGFSIPFQRGDPCSPTVLSPEGRRPAALATATTQLLLRLRKETYKGRGGGDGPARGKTRIQFSYFTTRLTLPLASFPPGPRPVKGGGFHFSLPSLFHPSKFNRAKIRVTAYPDVQHRRWKLPTWDQLRLNQRLA